MLKTVNHVSGGFTIRKISPKEIADFYFKGQYVNRSMPDSKIRGSTGLVKLGKEMGKDPSSEIYRFLDKSNNSQSILTTNHALYRYILDVQNNKSVDKPILKCKYCKRNILKTPVGLPISMIIKGDETHFVVIDSFCDFGCMFSHLKRKNMENRFYKDPLYMNVEQLMYCMYYAMYPDRTGTTIKDKPDWDLLRENGGPLTNEDFDSNCAEYVSVPSVIVLPSKKQYIKMCKK